jgi:putative ABC transport system permease protein
MIKNYFKTAFRNLVRNKAFSFINIAGLAIGISAALVIFLIVQYDFSFEKQHKDRERIYRIVSVFDFSGQAYKNSGVQFPMVYTFQKQATGLSLIVPLTVWRENQKLEIPAEPGTQRIIFKDPQPVFVDAAYFKMFTYEWVAGNAATSIQEPFQVVLTEKAAQQYFPKLNASQMIGKQIVFDDSVKTTVSGIVKNLAGNTDFTFKIFVSRATQEKTSLKPQDWDAWGNVNGNAQLFMLLAPGTTPDKIEKQAQAFLAKNQVKQPGDKTKQSFLLQPLSDIHFNADYGNFDQRTAHKPTLYGLIAVAIFLLLLGCINFINLTTAQASQRAKEIGIRKTMGSSKKQLVLQFLSETFFLTLIATILSIGITPLLLKIFSDFIPPELHFNLLQQPLMILFLAGLVITVSFLSGFYPAWVLSAFKPVSVLKNQNSLMPNTSRKALVRKSLTISQFIIAQVFILATLVVGQQIRYTLNKDLGFKKDAIVHFNINYRDTVSEHKTIITEKLKAIPEIAAVGLSTGTPSYNSSWSSTLVYKNEKNDISTDVEMKYADTNYIRQFQLKLVAGNNLESTDTVKQFLINETYAHILGFKNPQDAVGKYLFWSNKNVPITGVLADFHYQSLHEKIRPLAIGSWKKIHRVFAVTLQPKNADGSNWKAAIAKMEKAWKSIYPDENFDYQFLDENIAKYYAAEQNISSLLKWATGLAIFISSLGLLGLVMYTTNLRTKEIGVRKVLGASVSNIVSILSKDFILLVFIAFIIATPIAWWAMHKWLENFAYQTTLSFWMFLGAGFLSITIALITISFQTFKAASANPVKSLRTE